MSTPSVQELPAEWRARAEELSRDDAIGLTHYWKLKDCADELEAALNTAPYKHLLSGDLEVFASQYPQTAERIRKAVFAIQRPVAGDAVRALPQKWRDRIATISGRDGCIYADELEAALSAAPAADRSAIEERVQP